MSDMNKKGKIDWSKMMAHHQNQNGFTWKKKKQIACITVQYKRAITMDLKVNVAAGNM